MITYRGDKFVRGKKFKINEQEYLFVKRVDDKLLFKTKYGNLKITESAFNKLCENSTDCKAKICKYSDEDINIVTKQNKK